MDEDNRLGVEPVTGIEKETIPMEQRLVRYTIRHPVTHCTVYGYRRGDSVVVIRVDLAVTQRLHGRAVKEVTKGAIVRVGGMLRRFLAGAEEDLGAIAVDVSGLSGFAKDVLGAARRIPWGEVVSYSELARMAGHPRAVRAAASVMRNNTCPLIIPCHRVIRSDGTIGGFMGKKAGGCITKKRKLLCREGVII
ncbi:MAG: methylated-DNA--[protein]-cysteine S-methyltransferase [Chitinivibrionales bacterium]|nr:methylated-DNA--[protein]-cysteine S-methyltransferase [Chitinivibrionales bacterium]